MNGQWKGNYTGSVDGLLVVNVDEQQNRFAGAAFIFPSDSRLPMMVVPFRTQNKDKEFQFQANQLIHVDPISRKPAPWDAIKQHYPGVINSQHAEVKGFWDNNFLTLSWTISIGLTGKAVLPRSKADEPSKICPKVMTWQEFKVYVGKLEPRRFLFRGQNKPWRLRTSFHRTGRAELGEFLMQDLPALHRHLSARTRHVFNLSNEIENGAFYHLIQHHGYPTPLLDWTYSPYVAAFFAYRGISNEQATRSKPSDRVRTFVFDQSRWCSDWKQVLDLVTIQLHVSFVEFAAIENERAIPQQAVSTLTNVDDIESYIKEQENIQGKTYLTAIDLPVQDRKNVIRELNYMGITASALFPGLDGACEELKERNFYSSASTTISSNDA